MCGIAGFLDSKAHSSAAEMRGVSEQMGRSLQHRGPDSGGAWVDERCGIALAHRRLAIIDISENGHQPMVSADGRFVISFNGEIYNHLAVRKALEDTARAPQWRGHSDTETILAAVVAFGVAEALLCLRGMFAFALWDRKGRCLYLARDRVGEKPLYYGRRGTAFLFGSELKALRCHPAWTGEIDRGALTLYMRHGYVPAPHSIHTGIHKLGPGTLLRLVAGESEPVIETYWSAQDTVAEAGAQPFRGSPEEAVEGLHILLSEAVAEQMMADVPLGAFLSGGIDSSTIVALMQEQSRQRVRTFTIGFHEQRFDEAVYAKAIAGHLGTDHTELYIRPKEALDAIRLMPRIYDEPFADSSQLPTFLLAQLVGKSVTVALSGDGGDELFAGYDRYGRAEALMRRLEAVPAPVRRAAAVGIGAVPAAAWDMLLRPVSKLLPEGRRYGLPGEKLHKWADYFSLDRAKIYRHLASHCYDPNLLVRGGEDRPNAFTDPDSQHRDSDFQAFMMALDLVSYLPDDILTKVDRAAMEVSLETRIPLLDQRVIRYAWSLPRDLKVRNGQTKWVLRQVLHRHVPPSLIDRSKKGFSVPIEMWLRGPLRDWAEMLLDGRRIHEDGMLDAKIVRKNWQRYLAGDDGIASLIWNILMFQAWRDQHLGDAETRIVQVA